MCRSDEKRRICTDLKDTELIEWQEKHAPCKNESWSGWLCGDKCISTNDRCNNTCYWVPQYQCSSSGAEKFIKNPVVFDPRANQCLTSSYDYENKKPNIKAFLLNAGRLYCGYVLIACKGHFPGQCIQNDEINNKVYDCLDRSDEYVQGLEGTNVKTDIDYSQFERCDVSKSVTPYFYGPGMRCGDKRL